MSRDDGWRFLVLGRSLERVDMTARLLSAGCWPPPTARTGRRCCARAAPTRRSSRTHGGTVDPRQVAEFLLLDRLFPRSALHALATAEQCLAALDPARRAGMTDPARRPIGQIRTRLEYADPQLLADLPPTC